MTTTTRRKVLAGLGTTAAAAPLVSAESSRSIDVKVYWTQELEDNYDDWEGGDNFGNKPTKGHPKNVAQTYLQSNIAMVARTQQIHYNTAYDYSVTIADEPVDNFGTHSEWETWVENHPDDVASDANILLTYGSLDTDEYQGRGECTSCETFEDRPAFDNKNHIAEFSRAAIVSRSERIAHISPDTVKMALSEQFNGAWELQAVIHEVGHCLGFSHDIGDVYTTDHEAWDRWIWVTPMLSAYYVDGTEDVDLHCADSKPTNGAQDIIAVQLVFGQYATHYPINTTDATPVCR